MATQPVLSPDNKVSEVFRHAAKSKIVIFDDDPEQLKKYCASFNPAHYETIGVLVSPSKEYDWVFAHGEVKHDMPDTAKADWRLQDQRTGRDTVEAELRRLGGDTKGRHGDTIEYLDGVKLFRHGVTSKEEARDLLKQLQPDYVLSDLKMRAPLDPAKAEENWNNPNVVMGTDIMRIVAEEFSAMPRAIHSSERWVVATDEAKIPPYQKTERADVMATASVLDFGVFPKPGEDAPFDTKPLERHFAREQAGRYVG